MTLYLIHKICKKLKKNYSEINLPVFFKMSTNLHRKPDQKVFKTMSFVKLPETNEDYA